MTNPVCPYCNSESKLVTGLVIYPHRKDLADLSFYQCAPCDAYVGCHKGTTKPLGRLADAELRKWKNIAHRGFDAIWKGFKKRGIDGDQLTFIDPYEAVKTPGRMTRGLAYKYLAESMKIEQKHCHIGMFTIEQCKEAYAISQRGFDHEVLAIYEYLARPSENLLFGS